MSSPENKKWFLWGGKNRLCGRVGRKRECYLILLKNESIILIFKKRSFIFKKDEKVRISDEMRLRNNHWLYHHQSHWFK